jgi:predicted DCC family thiol-disulfide oxidoreductase YuxK
MDGLDCALIRPACVRARRGPKAEPMAHALHCPAPSTPWPAAPRRGWLLYDGCCPLCVRAIVRFGNALLGRGYGLAPLQDPAALRLLGMDLDQALESVRLVAPDGHRHDGADAVAQISRHFWYGWPLWLLARVPGIHALLRRLYREVNQRRRRPGRSCHC